MNPGVSAHRPPRMAFPLASARTYLATAHVLTDLWAGIITFTIVVAGLASTVSLAFTVVAALPLAWLTLWASRMLGRVERARARAFLGVAVADPHVRPGAGWWARLRGDLTSGATWREIAYHLVLLPVGVVGWSLTLAAWSSALFLSTLPAWVRLMDGREAHFWLFDVGARASWASVLPGLIGVLWVAPWTARGWARIDASLVRSLLGPNRSEQLEQRVETLSSTRALAVDAAEEERRRIERDLHDGAQQRLVALAIELGMARAKFDTDPEAARALLDEAHEDAQRAIAELRDLARGIHPVALTDRGLPGAIPGLAARSPIPAEVHLDVADRPVPAIEGIAYFVVSEALTNVAKHADATHVRIDVVRSGDRLLVEVRDDGRGGASLTAGTGLRGLADRAASVDGSLIVESPPGGPTVLRADLPCALSDDPRSPRSLR